MFSNYFSISPIYSITKLSPRCGMCSTPRSQTNVLSKSTFYTSNLFFHDRCIHQRMSSDCPFKSNQSRAKISILTPGCAVCLCGVMHTTEIDFEVVCTPWSFLTIRISRRNRKRNRKYFSLFVRSPDGFES